MSPTACDPNDLSWLTPSIALGGCLAPESIPFLARELGISRVIDLRAEERDPEELLSRFGIELLHLPTPDLQAVRQGDLWKGVHWIREAMDRRRKVLVHCQHGIGRSVVLACCALVSLGYSPKAALALAKEKRDRVSPSPEQLHSFRRWCEDWNGKSSRVSWDELADIAYGRDQEHA